MEKQIKNLLKKKNRWLVTGCHGFIGSNIVNKLLENNQIVYGIDRRKKKNIKNKNFTFIKGDLHKINPLNRIKDKINYVLHQASLTSVVESYQHPEKYIYENFSSYKNIVEFCINKKVKSLVFASSSAVYGNSIKKNFEESTKINAFENFNLSPYAISKKMMEVYSNAFKTSFPIISLRYFNVFGPGQKIIGNNLPIISNWINLMIHSKKLILKGDGSAIRNFIYIDDVVNSNILSAFKLKKNFVINICSSKCINLANLLILFKKLNKKLNISKNISIKRVKLNLKKEILYSNGSNNIAKKILAFNEKDSFEINLIKTIKWQLKNIY